MQALTALSLFVGAGLLVACGVAVNVGEPLADGDEARPIGPTAESGPLSWDGDWEWLTPQTTTLTLRAGWVAAPDDIWLVGDNGTVLRWDGKSRARVAYQGPLDATYRAIVATSTNDVVIAGDHAALYFNGITWTSSLSLATLDVRTLVLTGGDGYAGLTTNGVVFAGRLSGASHYQVDTNALDILPTAGGIYALKRDGVDLVRPAQPKQRVTSFAQLQGFPSSEAITEGRLIGTDPSSFRYVFGHSVGSQRAFGFFETPAAGSVPVFKYSWLASHDGLLSRVDANRIVMRTRRMEPSWLFDGDDWRQTDVADDGGVAAMVLPSGDAAILGKQGRLASVIPSATPGKATLVDHGQGGARIELFAVATDASAWAVRSTRIGDRWVKDTLGTWDEATGWQWYSIPVLPTGKAVAVAVAPLSRTSVWLVLRTTDEGNPEYDGGETLAHWDGTRFDVFRPAPKSLRDVVADGGGGFFALATNGELFHGEEDGELRLLGDIGTAGDDSFGLCTPRIAPVPGGKAWALDQLCRLSFWDGTTLQNKPTFRNSEAHGSGWLDFALWGSGDSSLWVTDPQRGLLHFDGTSWTVVWRSDNAPYGIFGADDEHVWFVDGAWSDRGVLHRWDGKRVTPVATAPHAHVFGGNRDSVWLAGDRALLRLRATNKAVH